MTEEPEQPEMYRHECKCCFLQFENEIERVDFCEFCIRNPAILEDKQMRLERMLAVMDKTLVYRSPEIFRLMYRVLNDRKS